MANKIFSFFQKQINIVAYGKLVISSTGNPPKTIIWNKTHSFKTLDLPKSLTTSDKHWSPVDLTIKIEWATYHQNGGQCCQYIQTGCCWWRRCWKICHHNSIHSSRFKNYILTICRIVNKCKMDHKQFCKSHTWWNMVLQTTFGYSYLFFAIKFLKTINLKWSFQELDKFLGKITHIK